MGHCSRRASSIINHNLQINKGGDVENEIKYILKKAYAIDFLDNFCKTIVHGRRM
jgi:hypothetical protein